MQPDEFFDNPELRGLTVTTCEFAVTMSDGADRATHEQVSLLLRRVRQQLQMDIAFVAEFVEERRVFRDVDGRADIDVPIQPGHSDPLEETYCQRIVDGRLPLAIPDTSLLSQASNLEVTRSLNIGAYLSAPVILRDGRVYGTLCCINHAAMPTLGELEVQTLLGHRDGLCRARAGRPVATQAYAGDDSRYVTNHRRYLSPECLPVRFEAS